MDAKIEQHRAHSLTYAVEGTIIKEKPNKLNRVFKDKRYKSNKLSKVLQY